MDLSSAMTNYMETYLQDCYTAMPAVIINIKDNGQLRADVQPVTNRVYRDDATAEYPPVLSVPLIMPATQTSALLLPVKQGDTVLLVWCQRDITQFKIDADVPHDPQTARWQDFNDAVAIVGLFPFSKSRGLQSVHHLPHNPEDLVVVSNLGTPQESELRMKPNGDVDLTVANTYSVKAKTINLQATNTNITSKIDMKGQTTINNIDFNQHVHAGVQSGPSTTTPPQAG